MVGHCNRLLREMAMAPFLPEPKKPYGKFYLAYNVFLGVVLCRVRRALMILEGAFQRRLFYEFKLSFDIIV